MNIINDLSSNIFVNEPSHYTELNQLTDLTTTSSLDNYLEILMDRRLLSDALLHDQYQDQSITGIINTSFNEDDNKYKRVLSDLGKQSLKTIQYRKDVCKNDYCPITQEKFKTRQKVTILPCNHGFNPESIDEWLETQRAECPMCRLKLDSIEIKNEDYTESSNIQSSRNYFLNSLNVLNSISHPFGRNQIYNTVPHSYISEEYNLQPIVYNPIDISSHTLM